MSTEREYDQDTDGDYDENTLDGSEGLDADTISTDGEDLTVDAPESWKPVEENDTLDEKLSAERPDVDLRRRPAQGSRTGRDPLARRRPKIRMSCSWTAARSLRPRWTAFAARRTTWRPSPTAASLSG